MKYEHIFSEEKNILILYFGPVEYYRQKYLLSDHIRTLRINFLWFFVPKFSVIIAGWERKLANLLKYEALIVKKNNVSITMKERPKYIEPNLWVAVWIFHKALATKLIVGELKIFGVAETEYYLCAIMK